MYIHRQIKIPLKISRNLRIFFVYSILGLYPNLTQLQETWKSIMQTAYEEQNITIINI